MLRHGAVRWQAHSQYVSHHEQFLPGSTQTILPVRSKQVGHFTPGAWVVEDVLVWCPKRVLEAVTVGEGHTGMTETMPSWLWYGASGAGPWR